MHLCRTETRGYGLPNATVACSVRECLQSGKEVGGR
jgi:hypothetical protein